MASQLTNAEKLVHSTVRIECELANGQLASGTGFFYNFAINGNTSVPTIVTNKHVVAGASKGKIEMTLADANGNPIEKSRQIFQLSNFEQLWMPHPEQDVDLCVMPIAALSQMAEKDNKKLFYVGLNKTLILTKQQMESLLPMEDITMIGYPNGIWDQVNNMPVIRRGISATHPSVDWNNKPEFLIDAACFPGSSGSPVFLFNHGSYPERGGATVLGQRLKLLGILYAGPQQTVTGEIKIINVPTQNVPIAVSAIPMNLGMVIKATKLEAF